MKSSALPLLCGRHAMVRLWAMPSSAQVPRPACALNGLPSSLSPRQMAMPSKAQMATAARRKAAVQATRSSRYISERAARPWSSMAMNSIFQPKPSIWSRELPVKRRLNRSIRSSFLASICSKAAGAACSWRRACSTRYRLAGLDGTARMDHSYHRNDLLRLHS